MSSHRYHVLVVEKDPSVRAACEQYLRDDPAGQFSVTVSNSGTSALAICQTRIPDCVVLDEAVLAKHGARLRVGPSADQAGSVAILLVDHADPQTIDRITQRGAADWLIRDHLDACRLRHTVRNAVDRWRLEQQADACQDALQRIIREHNEFASIVSHDLSAPARRIDGFCQLLARRYEGRLDAEAEEFIAFLRDESARLLRQIGDLLDYSRLSSRHQPARPTDSDDIVRGVLAKFQEQLRNLGVRVTCAPLPTVMADPDQLIQLFSNLVGNAIRFRGARPLAIQVGCQRRQNDWLFSVRDNGRGFDPKQKERVFQVFCQLSPEEGQDGTGMGLAACKRIVEIHGGQMWAESETGEGSCFWFTFSPAETTDSE
jgi:light-regulated signal transduction histidine kinase (bacteriophytochrome)